MAFGVALSINANMGISPISCWPYVLSTAMVGFGKVKISLDCCLVVISLIIGLAFADKVIGREGAVLATIFVGLSIKYFNKHIRFVDYFLGG